MRNLLKIILTIICILIFLIVLFILRSNVYNEYIMTNDVVRILLAIVYVITSLILFNLLKRNTYCTDVELPADEKILFSHQMAQFVHKDERAELMKINSNIKKIWKHFHIFILGFAVYAFIAGKGYSKIYNIVGVAIGTLIINLVFVSLWAWDNRKILIYKKIYKVPAYVMNIRKKQKSTAITVGYYHFLKECFVSDEFEFDHIFGDEKCPLVGNHITVYVAECGDALRIVRTEYSTYR